MLLALDISTSIIGWSLWENKKLKDQGFYSLTNSKGEPKDLADRLDLAVNYFRGFSGVTKIAAEAAMEKFSEGGTTARTMNKLIVMNFGLTYTLSRLWDVEVLYITVREARKLADINVPRQPKGKKKDPNWTKKHVVKGVAKKYPRLIFELTKSGNPKKGMDDMADAIVVGEAALSDKYAKS